MGGGGESPVFFRRLALQVAVLVLGRHSQVSFLVRGPGLQPAKENVNGEVEGASASSYPRGDKRSLGEGQSPLSSTRGSVLEPRVPLRAVNLNQSSYTRVASRAVNWGLTESPVKVFIIT